MRAFQERRERHTWAQVPFVVEGKWEHRGISQVFKWYSTSSLLAHLASPVCISSWFTHDLYTSTGLVLIMRDLSSMISFTTGARSWRRVFCPRAPRLKLTTILMTVGFPVTISCIWSTLELYQEQKSSQVWPVYAVVHFFKTHSSRISLFLSWICLYSIFLSLLCKTRLYKLLTEFYMCYYNVSGT